MASFVTMPKLGMDMKEGTIVQWLKYEGDTVKKGESLFEVSTDKANVEVEAIADGVLLKIYYKEGDSVPINQNIAVIGKAGEEIPEFLEKAAAKKEEKILVKEEKQELMAFKAENKNDKIRISPRARKLAKKNNIDYSLISGSGANGRIMEKDITEYIKNYHEKTSEGEINHLSVPAERNGKIIPMQGIRKVIASRMLESLATSAQANHRMDIDMTKVMELRRELNKIYENKGIKISITDIIVKIVTRALKDNPIVNSTLVPEGIKLLDEIHIGIAVAVDNGLVVPVIPDTLQKDIAEIAALANDLITRAREGQVKPEEMKGGTFTITNLGMYDVDSFTAIINPPESAILAVGRINEKPVVYKGEIVIRPIATLSLTYDHRVIDGAPAAIFLKRIKQLMENPYLLI